MRAVVRVVRSTRTAALHVETETKVAHPKGCLVAKAGDF